MIHRLLLEESLRLKSSQFLKVTFIYIVLFTIQIVSKQLHSDNMKVIQHRSIMLLNIKCPQLSKPEARQQWQGTKTPSGDWMEKKTLGEPRLSWGQSSSGQHTYCFKEALQKVHFRKVLSASQCTTAPSLCLKLWLVYGWRRVTVSRGKYMLGGCKVSLTDLHRNRKTNVPFF